jgi:hypothetical protein
MMIHIFNNNNNKKYQVSWLTSRKVNQIKLLLNTIINTYKLIFTKQVKFNILYKYIIIFVNLNIYNI